jgi:F0F1-type ATP synthase epsilon subunit
MPLARRLATLALVPAMLLAAAAVRADQPHMEAALSNLEQALAQLKQASSDKGGNRADAIRAVEKAINEVRKGMEYDRTHVKPGEALRR